MRPSLIRCLALWIGCVSFCGFYGCQREAKAPQRGGEGHETNHAKFRSALADLVRRERDTNASVIFKDARTRKYVQFLTGYDGEGGLILHLPSEALDQAEGQRAESFFQELGVRAREDNVIAPDELVGRRRTFEMKFGQDAEAAAHVAEQIFERVYQFPADFALVVTER
jgi:hypothetical protein